MSDVPPRVTPADFDALEAAARRCEEALLRTAETRRRLKLDESTEMGRLRAENAALKRRVRFRETQLREALASLDRIDERRRWEMGSYNERRLSEAVEALRRRLPKRRAK